MIETGDALTQVLRANLANRKQDADIDLAGRRRQDADDLILDDGRFADARLRLSGPCSDSCGKKKRGDRENAVTPVHSITDRSVPPSYRIARAFDVVKLSQAAPYNPDG